MSIKDGYNNKKVTFDTQDRLEDKIDRLTVMMSKLAVSEEGVNKPFKPMIHQSKRRGQTRNFYDRCNYQNRYRKIVEIEYNLVVEFNMDRIIEVDQAMDKALGMTLGEEILEAMQEHIKIKISKDRIIEVDIKETTEMIIMKEIAVGLEKGHIWVISEKMMGVVVIVG